MFGDLPTLQQPSMFLTGMAATDWVQYVIPPECRFVIVNVYGAGGGGGGGVGGASGTSRAGGAGGSSGNNVLIAYPRFFLPPSLYVQVGKGGAGGASDTAGSAGATSYVGLVPDNSYSFSNMLMKANGGTAGGAGAAGVGGICTVQSVQLITDCIGFSMGLGAVYNAEAGIVGGSGTAATTTGLGGQNLGSPASSRSQGQAGGGASCGTDNTSHSTGVANGTVAPYAVYSSARAGDGFPGGQFFKPFLGAWGGFGGASSGTSVGFKGGNGVGFGCGGGGGGAGTGAGNGGAGGIGGDGLVQIFFG